MTNLEVAHAWANKTMPHCYGYFYFIGDTIYSFDRDFPIAKHLNDDTVLFTLDSDTCETDLHIAMVYAEVWEKKLIYVPSLKNHSHENFLDWRRS